MSILDNLLKISVSSSSSLLLSSLPLSNKCININNLNQRSISSFGINNVQHYGGGVYSIVPR
ncbi:hypothetical protein RB653_005792 [Dictyostelium firmibasis]|uniref:Uncharacterized protein n=1 Tax=Dictyostelium firmibasis TaxID=79012 RepID=A0AAN7U1Z5_9MYCE